MTSHETGRGAPDPPVRHELIAALGRTRAETAGLVRGLEAHRAQTELLLEEITRHELDTFRLLRDLAGVLDTFDRLLDEDGDVSVESYRAGIRMTAAKFVDLLCNNSGIELIGRRGEIADPATHHVVEVRTEQDMAEGAVIKVIERGIRYRGEVARPASVIVSSGKGTPS